MAARRRLRWIDHFTGEADALARTAQPRVGDRHGREQRLGAGVPGACEERLGRGELDDAPDVHHGDPIADMLDDTQIMSDEDAGQAEFVLEVLQQVERLRLHGHIERRDRLVRDHELGI